MADRTPRSLSHHELDKLSSDELIDRIRRGREAGDTALASAALAVLCFRHAEDVKRRVAIKVPDADVEDVAMEAVTSAIQGAFDGTMIGQFRAWLHTIVDRRIADYHRRRERQPATVPLGGEADDEDAWGHEPATGDASAAVDVQSVVDECFEALGKDSHKRVVELNIFEDMPAQEVADKVNAEHAGRGESEMTVANVHQITSRFRKQVRARLAEGPG